MTDVRWFSRVGMPLDDLDRRTLDALWRARRSHDPQGAADIVLVANVHAAVAWVESEQSGAGWNEDEEERERLWSLQIEHMTESELLTRLAAVIAAAAPTVRAAAARVLSQEAGSDTVPIDTAAAAALLCLHQHALARMADAGDDHPFVLAYALFARGRWPLGRHADRYGVY
jgi:hypothetical protein